MKTVHNFDNWIVVHADNTLTRLGKLAHDLMFNRIENDRFMQSLDEYRARNVKFMAVAVTDKGFTVICGKDTKSIEQVEANIAYVTDQFGVKDWFPVEFE